MTNPGTGAEWLIIVEPTVVISTSPYVATGGPTNQSRRITFGDDPSAEGGSAQTSFGRMLRQRGQANIGLFIAASDSYEPTVGCPIFLYDVSAAGQFTVFSGTIANIEWSWYGLDGDRLAALSCVSFEQAFDTIRVPGRLYNQESAGNIFRDLLALASGWQGNTGTIEDGAAIDTFLVEDLPTIAEQFDKLAILSGYVWSVDVETLDINFAPPAITASPFTVSDNEVLREAMSYRLDRQDFRDRQYITGDYDSFGRDNFVAYGPLGHIYTLPNNKVHDLTGASITKNTQNTATGTFSGQPDPGDTVTINYPPAGSSYNWAANSPYQVNWYIIDPNNHKQICTSQGTSGMTEPHWNDIGGHTTDASVQWLDKGPIGFGPFQVAAYSFVTALDNTAFGQVLIGATTGATCQNLVDAINANPVTAGQKFSLPTWFNPLVNADQPTGTSFVVRSKYTGQGAHAALARQGTAFNWSSSQTIGGTTTFGTYTLSVGIATAASQEKSVSYTPGSNVVYLNGTFESNDNIAIEYHRLDGNAIAVENTQLVAARAAIEHGTGKYQALVADNSATPVQMLAEAIAALDAFEEIPAFLDIQTLRPGLDIGQAVLVSAKRPQGPNPEDGSPHGAYLYRREIDIQPSSPPTIVDLAGFTWQFSGNYPWLATVPNGGRCYNDSGFDIIFCNDENGQVLANWEIQSYDPATGDVVFWVLAAEVLERDAVTKFWLFYGNPDITSFQSPGNAWGGHFSGVFHLTESGPPYQDSSATGTNSVGVSTPPPTQVGGLWGKAQQFSGAEFIEFVNQIQSGFIEPGISFSCWFKSSASGTLMGIVDSNAAGVDGAQGYMSAAGKAVQKDVTHGATATSAASINDGAWHYIIFIDSGLGFSVVLVDNVQVSTTYLGTPVPQPGHMLLGALRGFTNFLDGTVCELHTFGVDPLPQWSKDEYVNQNPATIASWYTVGSEVTWGKAPWIIQEIEGELIPTGGNLGYPNGHFRYTAHCVNIAQIGDFLEFWRGLGGGSGGAGGSIPTYSGGTAGAAGSIAGSAVGVEQAGFLIGIEPNINLIPGIGASFFAVDDPTNQRVNVTIGLSSVTGITYGRWSDLPPAPSTGAGTCWFFSDSLYTNAVFDGSNWVYFTDGKTMHLPQLQNWQGVQGHGGVDTVHGGYSALSSELGYAELVYQYGNLQTSGGDYFGTATFRVIVPPLGLGSGLDTGLASLMLSDGTTLVELGYYCVPFAANLVLRLKKYASVDGNGSGSSLTAETGIPGVWPFAWLKVEGSAGADITWSVSADGYHWQVFYNALENTIFSGTPTLIGYGCRSVVISPTTTTDLVNWEGDLGATQFTVSTTTDAIGEGTPSREITITTAITTGGTSSYALDDDGAGGIFYPASPVTIGAGAAGQHTGFVYIAPIGTSIPVTIKVTGYGGGVSSFRKLEMPIGNATVYAKDLFPGSAGASLIGHTPVAGAAWVMPKHTGTLDLKLDGAGGVYGQGSGSAWSRNYEVAIDRTKCGTSNLSSFPVLVHISNSAIKSTGGGGDVTSGSGFDIVVFTDQTQTAYLPWEVEKWDSSSGDWWAWVQVPTVNGSGAGSNSKFVVSWGNSSVTTQQNTGGAAPANVWTTASYQNVYHLSESSSPYHDSTAGANNSFAGTYPTQATGKIFDGQSFANGSNQYIESVNPYNGGSQSATFSCWIKTSSLSARPAGQVIIDGRGNGLLQGCLLYMTKSGSNWLPTWFCNNAAQLTGSANLNDGNWHYLVGVISGGSAGTLSLYVDGSSVASGPGTGFGNFATSASNMFIGIDIGVTATAGFDGLIDEVRVLKSAVSADFVVTEYNNQNSPGNIGAADFLIFTSIVPAGAGGTAEYIIPTVAPQADNDVAITYTGVDTSKLIPTAVMFATNVGSYTGYVLYCDAGGNGVDVYVTGTKTTFTTPTGTPVSGAVLLRIACRTINASQYLFFLVNGDLVTGAPWHNNALGSGDAGVRPDLSGIPATTDSVMTELQGENADWS